MRALVVGAGLAGLAAAEKLLDAGARVTVIDAFPVPGGRVASFEAAVPVAGLVPGDVVEHGLHAWFQHYHALHGLMERAGIPRPPLAGQGIHFWSAAHGHTVIEGGPLFWLVNSLKLPEDMRGPRGAALAAFGRLIVHLDWALEHPAETDRESAITLLRRTGVPEPAIDFVFRRCLFSLTSLPLEELSSLELLRWMSSILPDPRIRCIDGGATQVMAAPIVRYLEERGASFRFGVEVTRMALRPDGRVRLTLRQAPDRTGLRHVLVQGFRPAEPPDPEAFDAVVCTLPWERLIEASCGDPAFAAHPAWVSMKKLRNVHPMTVRLWFERPLEGVDTHYVLSADTVFDVLRPTREPHRYPGVHLVDLLIDNVETHLPGFAYRGERYIDEPEGQRPIEERVLADLERLYPGQIRGNRVLRRFLHTREGIIACHPGTWEHRPPQYIGLPSFVLAGDYTRQAWGVCMEGATRSGQLAVEALLAGRPIDRAPWAFRQVAQSLKSVFERE